MDNAKPAVTPMETSKIEALPDGYECPLEDRTWYARAIGLLMYATLGTRVEIAYSVSFLNRYLGNPSPQYMRATKRIMQYLRGTTKLELTFCGEFKPLVGYTDLDWAGDIETRRSTSGFLFNIGSGAISWSSKRQPTVSLFLQSRIRCANLRYQGSNLATITSFSAPQG